MRNYTFELVGMKRKEINIQANTAKEANDLLKAIVENSDLITFADVDCDYLRSELVEVTSEDDDDEPDCIGDCENCPYNGSEEFDDE